MNHRISLRLLAIAALLASAGCASTGFVPTTQTMPAARAALRPEYRLFYDALLDYGDWVLIEPYGFVFRPRVDFVSFRPYQYGFWAPSDPWGWVWISAEPFGWATYHYGYWFRDRFQGWVWSPSVDWTPAQVSWEIAGTFAGWAPLAPPVGGGGSPGMSGGAYLYAPIARLGSTDLTSVMVTREDLGTLPENARPIHNVQEREGVLYNAGPSFELVERARGGPLPRVRIEDALATSGTTGRKAEPSGAPSAATIEAARAAAASAARQASELIESGGSVPARLPVLRAVAPAPATAEPPPAAPKGSKAPTPKGAAADTTR